MSSLSTGSTGRRLLPGRVVIRNWPLLDDGWISVLTVGGYIALGTAAGVLTQSIPMTTLGLVALAGTQWRFWIPVRFELGPRGVSRSLLGHTRLVVWSTIRTYEVHRRGVQIWPQVESPFLPAWYIRWKDQREPLLEILAYYRSGPVGSQAAGTEGITSSRGSSVFRHAPPSAPNSADESHNDGGAKGEASGEGEAEDSGRIAP